MPDKLIPSIDATRAWYGILQTILNEGYTVSPRTKTTLEVPHLAAAFPIARPAIVCPPRKPYYKFMAAEALWILSGSDRVEDIAPYNANMAAFSDDGRTFFGAYGPPVVEQLPYVVAKLIEDKDTRQAVLTIWRQKPGPSRDIPCTLAIHFVLRNCMLHAHVYMRSSDAWLGVPYDFFTFAMIAVHVACALNSVEHGTVRHLGYLYWTASSSHLYENDWHPALRCLEHSRHGYNEDEAELRERRVTIEAVRAGDWDALELALLIARDSNAPVSWPVALHAIPKQP